MEEVDLVRDYIVPVNFRLEADGEEDAMSAVSTAIEGMGLSKYAAIQRPIELKDKTHEQIIKQVEEGAKIQATASYKDRCVLDTLVYAIAEIRGRYFGSAPVADRDTILEVFQEAVLSGDASIYSYPDEEPDELDNPGDRHGDEGLPGDDEVAGEGEVSV